MALSVNAQKMKSELQKTVVLRRELQAIDEEWRDILALEEEFVGLEEVDMQVLHDLYSERAAHRKALAAAQLRNFSLIQHTPLTDLQRRVMKLRYVQGLTWGDLIERVGHCKQHILREHNKALEKVAQKVAKGSPV